MFRCSTQSNFCVESETQDSMGLVLDEKLSGCRSTAFLELLRSLPRGFFCRPYMLALFADGFATFSCWPLTEPVDRFGASRSLALLAYWLPATAAGFFGLPVVLGLLFRSSDRLR
jgi:hypothetical protein